MQLIEVAEASAEGLGLAGSALWMDQQYVGIGVTRCGDPVCLDPVQQIAVWLGRRHHRHPITEATKRCSEEQELPTEQATEGIKLVAGTVKAP